MTRLHAKRHKFNARPTTVDGIRFASLKESRRYQELKLLEKAGEIRGLMLQPEYKLTVGTGLQIGRYVADFHYYDQRVNDWVTEDCKGFRTPLYRWKRKHVEAQYGIKVLET